MGGVDRSTAPMLAMRSMQGIRTRPATGHGQQLVRREERKRLPTILECTLQYHAGVLDGRLDHPVDDGVATGLSGEKRRAAPS